MRTRESPRTLFVKACQGKGRWPKPPFPACREFIAAGLSFKSLMNTYDRWKEMGRPIDYLMTCWLAAQSSDSQVKEENRWAFMEPVDEARDNPERAWECILFVEQDPRFPNEALGVMAAGALEDLLSYHGPAFIDRVEQQAKTSRRFAWMLGGVWRSTMSDEIWSRVQAVWDRLGWDGNPAEA
jgi:hypothetical protein